MFIVHGRATPKILCACPPRAGWNGQQPTSRRVGGCRDYGFSFLITACPAGLRSPFARI
jgi:hypothetical protein